MKQRLPVAEAAAEAFARRAVPSRLLADDAPRLAQACHDMAIRFHQGGKLLIFGKRALPAIALTNDVATVTGVARDDGFDEVFAHQLCQLGAAGDIALGISADGRCANVLRGLQVDHDLDLLTVALAGGDGGPIAASPAVDHAVVARSDDPRIIKEVHTTAYHVLWELVHVFFEQPGLLGPGVAR